MGNPRDLGAGGAASRRTWSRSIIGGSPSAVAPFAFAVGVPGGIAIRTLWSSLPPRRSPSGFSVGRIVESRRVVVKALGPLVSGAPPLAGAAFLGWR